MKAVCLGHHHSLALVRRGVRLRGAGRGATVGGGGRLIHHGGTGKDGGLGGAGRVAAAVGVHLAALARGKGAGGGAGAVVGTSRHLLVGRSRMWYLVGGFFLVLW